MLPVVHSATRLLIAPSVDWRPPPREFAEFFAVASVINKAIQKVHDDHRTCVYEILAKAAMSAQVFDFGPIKEKDLIEESKIGGSLMSDGLLKPPYPSVLYWYTLTDINYSVRALSGNTDTIRYGTLLHYEDDVYYIADFVAASPDFAADVKHAILSDNPSRDEREQMNGAKFLFMSSGVGVIRAAEGGRWGGHLYDRPGTQHSSVADATVLGALADGVSAMSMILATKGIGLRREPAPAKLNVKREKAGKPPYPSVTYVDARQYFEAVQRAALGGTHASPVPHLRRGHRRTYSDGRSTWVRSCMVNCRSLDEAQLRDHYIVKTGAFNAHR